MEAMQTSNNHSGLPGNIPPSSMDGLDVVQPGGPVRFSGETPMSSATFIRIVNWGSYQHYKKRNPPWVKVYVSLLTNDQYLDLDRDSRLLLFTLFLLAPRYQNAIPLDSKMLALAFPSTVNTQPLVNAQFIECYQDASNVLANCYNGASKSGAQSQRREEKSPSLARHEEEKKKPTCFICHSLATRHVPDDNAEPVDICDSCHGYLRAAGQRFVVGCRRSEIEKIVLAGKAKRGQSNA
jgi:hypothetical protein